MSRRVSKNTPDSLKDVKQLEEQAVARTTSAEAKLSELTNAISEAEQGKKNAEAELSKIEEIKELKLTELGDIDAKISDAKDELRKVEGELQAANTGVEEEKAKLDSGIEEKQAELEQLRVSHQNQMSLQERQQDDARKSLAELETNLKDKESEVKDTESKLQNLTDEVNEKKGELTRLSEAEKELEEAEHQLLVKLNEVKAAEEAHTEMQGKYNDEKVKYEEVSALRVTEEIRVEAEIKKLIEKKQEVESKIRSLRFIQEGVDKATLRLKRREKDIELKNHLSKPREVTKT